MDYDDISVSRFAKVGGCSVGAFYGRFSDKKAFLDFLVGEAFRQATSCAEIVLDDATARGLSLEKTAKKIAEQISEQFGDAEFAGIVRAAVKLGLADSKSRAPYDVCRGAVTERAIALLAPHLRRGSEERVREAIQAAFGILTDAAISKPAALRPGSARMTEAVSAVIVNLVSASGNSAGKSNKPSNREILTPQKAEITPAPPDQKSKARKVRTL
ncbi:MAG: hypothetical protein A3E78_09670 [Alphaproteobacteria bacterium RIFCSPHIGHO2_12_FULL_63_12]|nr:MAG: hypothetical protein A3E78_09670 [Alphaproteobacteria bacterium RIFCSPHIGHO2_12_FULL_63_12]